MTTQSRKTGFPDFVADVLSAEALRRQFIEAPMEAAQQSALGTAGELATLMGILPDAFAASQRRELTRILKSGNEKDSRVAALQASIAQADVLVATARRGQARVQRAIAALTGNGDVFHGFVSDRDVAPLKGLTVRLTDHKSKGAKAFTAMTDEEGYFSIDLGTDKPSPRDSDAKPNPINLSKWMADLMAGLSQDTSPAPAASTEAGIAQVEILNANGKLLHRDPTFVALSGGSIYREYVITAIELSPEQASRSFMSRASQAGTDVPPSRPTATEATKKSSRRAKTVRPKNRK